MKQVRLFKDDSLGVAARQAKTDRLILGKLLESAGKDFRLNEEEVVAAHTILLKWADFETSGRLAKFKETQLQGDFLNQVFGEALGYANAVDSPDGWQREQHTPVKKSAEQVPDAFLGRFTADTHDKRVVVELKGPTVYLDRRSGGRTPVDQCWDYMVNLPPSCRWGIVSNYVSFRLYERNSTKRAYEHFTLQSLRKIDEFRKFFAIFHRKGLVEGTAGSSPRVEQLVVQTNDKQRMVSDSLYESYSQNRIELIRTLKAEGHSSDLAVEMAQRLFDRVIFIAFCEDRRLLPEQTIAKAYSVAGFQAVTNPRWENFKNLFRFIDEGNEAYEIPKYNGGLFAKHAVDDLKLPDEPSTNFFKSLSTYDFRDEVNLEVLGHLFERSITELEKFKETGLFEGKGEKAKEFAQMPQSVRRKQLGVYYTPPSLTSRIVQYTVDELIDERFAAAAVKRGIEAKAAASGVVPDDGPFWREALGILRGLKIVDPACGSGAFLFQAYNVLEARYQDVIGHLELTGAEDAEELADQIPHFILNENLYGVDLSPEAVEITQLALWIRSATPGQTLASLARNIVHGNSLVHDPAIHPAGFDWRERFPEVFNPPPSKGGARGGTKKPDAKTSAATRRSAKSANPSPDPSLPGRGGFDCVIGNPPWERIKLQEREFFSLPAPEIATATNAAKRRALVAKLEKEQPGLYAKYLEAQSAAEQLLDYCRGRLSPPSQGGARGGTAKPDAKTSAATRRSVKSANPSPDPSLPGRGGVTPYPLTGQGDINLYAVFAELAYDIVAPEGRVGLLTPSGIASDKTTMDFFAAIAESKRLIRLYDFENRTKKLFPEVDGRFKFCILNFGGAATERKNADYLFFAHSAEELDDPTRHIKLTGADIKLLNPNTRTCPIFRTRRDAEITKAIYGRVPVLIDRGRKGPTGNLWGITFKTMFHQTNDAELFREAEALKDDGFKLHGNQWKKGKQVYLPLYEAKMVQAYDHRAADVVTDAANWVRQGQTAKTSLVSWQNPEHLATSRFWVSNEAVQEQLGAQVSHFLGYKDVTSPTNQRTMIAAMLPVVGVVNSAPLVFTAESPRRDCCLLGNLNSFAWDFLMRQKIGNVHLNFFLVEQIPTLPPDAYAKPCPWRKKETLESWISERVLKLTCTAEDMLPLADACEFRSGSFAKEYEGRLNKWDEGERARLMAELDAAYFHLYGIDRDDAEYILSTFKAVHDRNPLFEDQASTAEHILALYDEYAR